jgi:hypothetical protein
MVKYLIDGDKLRDGNHIDAHIILESLIRTIQ